MMFRQRHLNVKYIMEQINNDINKLEHETMDFYAIFNVNLFPVKINNFCKI